MKDAASKPPLDKDRDVWIQRYLQAKAAGDTKMMKIYEAILLKLKIKLPRL